MELGTVLAVVLIGALRISYQQWSVQVTHCPSSGQTASVPQSSRLSMQKYCINRFHLNWRIGDGTSPKTSSQDNTNFRNRRPRGGVSSCNLGKRTESSSDRSGREPATEYVCRQYRSCGVHRWSGSGAAGPGC